MSEICHILGMLLPNGCVTLVPSLKLSIPGHDMQQIRNGYRGARVLLHVNADFLLYVATLGAALLAAAYFGTL